MHGSSRAISLNDRHTTTITLFPSFTGSNAVQGLEYDLAVVEVIGIGAIYQSVLAFRPGLDHPAGSVCLLFKETSKHGTYNMFLLSEVCDGKSELQVANTLHNPTKLKIQAADYWVKSFEMSPESLDRLRRKISSKLG
ncbi:hypothetical protein K2P47_04185 [Patescibacteria group bacterium]|nr:hypothetical protein [Patescibacteria group bacterium]